MPWAKIARRVDRHRTTISREVERNGGRDLYRPAIACQRALTARRRARACRLTQGGELRDRVTAELKLSRSPVAIWADLAADGIEDRPCVETIYAAVYGGVLGKLAPQWPSPLA
jgi:IS30 family transposase